MKKLIPLVIILLVSNGLWAEPTTTRKETIHCTIGTSGNLMNQKGLFLAFGYNTDSTRQVCLAFKMNRFKEGNYSTADNTFVAGYSFVTYSSKKDLKTTKLFDVLSANFDVSINQVGDTIFSGTMSAMEKNDSTDVTEFTVFVNL